MPSQACAQGCVLGCWCKAAHWSVTPNGGRLEVVTMSTEQGISKYPGKLLATKENTVDLCPEVDSSQMVLEIGHCTLSGVPGTQPSQQVSPGPNFLVNVSSPSPGSTACWDYIFQSHACLSVTFFRKGDK